MAQRVESLSYPFDPPSAQNHLINFPLGMYVAWNTYEHIAQPTVNYGLSPDTLTFSADSTNSVTYPTSRTWSNSVLITGLTPATTYCELELGCS
jgi:hypothetical protein